MYIDNMYIYIYVHPACLSSAPIYLLPSHLFAYYACTPLHVHPGLHACLRGEYRKRSQEKDIGGFEGYVWRYLGKLSPYRRQWKTDKGTAVETYNPHDRFKKYPMNELNLFPEGSIPYVFPYLHLKTTPSMPTILPKYPSNTFQVPRQNTPKKEIQAIQTCKCSNRFLGCSISFSDMGPVSVQCNPCHKDGKSGSRSPTKTSGKS